MFCLQAPSEGLRRAYGQCGQLQHFFRQWLLYMSFEVVEPAWQAFQAALRTGAAIDQVRTARIFG